MSTDWPSAMLGTALPDTPAGRAALRDQLIALWQSQYGPLGDLSADLQLVRNLFSPISTSRTVRRILAELSTELSAAGSPHPPLVEHGPAGGLLIAPEGRVAIDLLDGRDEPRAAHALSLLAEAQRDVTRHRLRQVTTDLADSGKPLQVPALGLLVSMLLNGNVDEHSALPRGDLNPVVEQAIAMAVEAFAAVIAPSKRRNPHGQPRRLGSWQLGELIRRDEHLIFRDATRLHVVTEQERNACAQVGLVLARRRRLTETRLTRAIEAMIQVLQANRAAFIGNGLTIGDSSRHECVSASILVAFRSARTTEAAAGSPGPIGPRRTSG